MNETVTAVTGVASSVATSGLEVIAAILPVLATVIAAIIVANLGIRLVKRFTR